MFEFKLPDLGEGIHEGELLKWYVEVGEEIEEDADLMDVETDKAAVTIPSPRKGKIAKLNGSVGDTLHVGDVVVVIDDGSGGSMEEAAPKEEPKQESKAEEPKKEEAKPAPQAAKTSPAPSATTPGSPLNRVPAAPATRRLARELGLDINQVKGSGPGGRVSPDDVRAFSEGKPQAATAATTPPEAAGEESREAPVFSGGTSGIPFFEVEQMPDFEEQGPVEREPVRSIRRKVAKKMVASMVMVPHVAHMDEADVTDIEAFRAAERKRREGTPGGKLTLLPFVIKAMTGLLKRYPMFNASLDPHREELVYKKYYNIGFAADTDRGLMVPVVKGTESKSIIQVSADIVDLATKAREGALDPADMRGGTFTITNVGPIGGTGLIPTINYPEVAILGMGRVTEKPVVRDGEIVIRKMLPLTLAFDHRVADGAQAAHMVTELCKLLSDPNQLLLES
ncbi:2-oxo acid dehydrogenase subunit E2 [bacterium]|nr:2-oxo acid dehydrogenase subunit E2 [bacterium]